MSRRAFMQAVRAANPGLTITWKPAVSEFRINVVNGTEDTAYYTSDRDDAAATARVMWDLHFGPDAAGATERRVRCGHEETRAVPLHEAYRVCVLAPDHAEDHRFTSWSLR